MSSHYPEGLFLKGFSLKKILTQMGAVAIYTQQDSIFCLF